MAITAKPVNGETGWGSKLNAHLDSLKEYVDDSIAGTVGAGTADPLAVTGTNGSNGTATLPNGMIFKWGSKSIANSANVVFADEGVTAFPNACFQVVACQGEAGTWGGGAAVYSVSASGFTFNWGGTFTATIRWMAIGY